MNRIRYALALMYVSIKTDRRKYAAYFKLRFGMAFGAWLLAIMLLLLLKVSTPINLIPAGKKLFIGCSVIYMLAVMGAITIWFPEKDLQLVTVPLHGVHRWKYYYSCGLFLTIFLIAILVILDARNPHFRF